MKKFIFLIIFIIIMGGGVYTYLFDNQSIYSAILPATYEDFEKNMFNVLIKLKPEEKKLLLNYAVRFKKRPSQISVKEALENERNFEKTNEGTLFFSKLKEDEEKNNLLERITNSAFVTFVDFSSEENFINVIFSLKNKSSETITNISGDSYFEINSDKFITSLEFNGEIPPNDSLQVTKKFNFSEFPALKDLSHQSSFKMIIKQIRFSNGTSLLIN